MRFVAFSASILSEFENPQATSTRAVLHELAKLGHMVTHLEERTNRPLRDLMLARGSAAMRSFSSVFPDIAYRTYDLPVGRERQVWLSRELAIADAVIALPGTPEAVLTDLSAFKHPRLVRLVSEGLGEGELRLSTHSDAQEDVLLLGPAASSLAPLPHEFTSGVVAYESRPSPDRVANADWKIDLTGVCGTDWSYLPEVDLIDRFRRTEHVLIAGSSEGSALVRVLTPLGAGCRVSLLSAAGPIPGAIATAGRLPDRLDARVQAQRILARVTDVRRSRGLANR